MRYLKRIKLKRIKSRELCALFKNKFAGCLVAQLVKLLTGAQVLILRFLSSSPAWGSVLTIESLKPASDSVPLSLCPSPAHSLCLSLKNK